MQTINTCIKTGCHIFVRHYGLYAYGDAFKYGNTYLFRIVHLGEPAAPVIHFTIDNHADRFDVEKPVETWVVEGKDCIDHGYDGVPT